LTDLTDLKKSVSQLNDEELFNLMKDIRQSRRTTHEKKSVKKADGRERVSRKVELDLSVMIEGMTPEMKDKLLKQMGG